MKASAELSLQFDPSMCATLVEVLHTRALYQPNRLAYTFLLNGETEEKHVTYAELERQARAIAAMLQRICSPAARVLLFYPSGLEYISAFFGCLYAGMIAVPAYPPSSDRSVPRIQTIAADAGATVALTVDAVLAKMRRLFGQVPEFSDMRLIATDTDEVAVQAEQWQRYLPTPQSLAFLQYTSGSTGTPRGVMASHGNVMHNSEMIRKRCQHTPESVGISWLPLFHDAGLIEGILQPLYVGYHEILMAPAAFIQRPFRWLEAISRYRCTTTEAPNFAYELCMNRITSKERARLDLQSWCLAANGAEPVRAETIERFTAVFAECGLKKTALTPAYGLAETTLLVACGSVESETTVVHLDRWHLEEGRVLVTSTHEPGKTVDIVSCGAIAEDQRVVIVNPETMQACQAEVIGEIWVAGPSMAQGYWQRPLETEHTFHACIKNTGEGPFVRTGDLGFVYKGEIYVTGRLKDLIILRGRNYYPQDIERSVEGSHPSLRPGCGAAFSVEVSGEERLVIVQEVERHHSEPEGIIETIRRVIAEEYEISTYAVVLLRYGSLLKTSSGKIQRRACREAFLNHGLPAVASHILHDAPPVADQRDVHGQQTFLRQLEEAIQTQKRELLLALVTEQVYAVLSLKPEQPITPEQSLLSLGMDSLLGTQLVNRLETRLGDLPGILTFMMSEPTINKLVEYLTSEVLLSQAPDRQVGEKREETPRAILARPNAEGRVQDDRVGDREQGAQAGHVQQKHMQFSLLYFASDEAAISGNKYELLLEGARFADRHDFTAVWVPERHFHPFGGLYPNPALLASALSMVTEKIRLRAGSVVLPMHHPLQIAEDWSVVDNLSSGRVDLAFAVGWNPNDFALAPMNYADRKNILFSGIETFQKLWRGDSIALPNGLGKEIMLKIHPLPRQRALTPWITCTGSPQRFIEAGTLGAHILTGLLFQSLEELAEKINAYRAARARHGHDPAAGHVTLMLHTFVGEEMEMVRQTVRPPFIEYLRSSVDLWQHQWEDLAALSAQNQEQVLSYAFERYFQTHGLFGTPRTCMQMVDRLKDIGIDEIACLIDFGVDIDTVLDGLCSLNALRKRSQRDRQVQSCPEDTQQRQVLHLHASAEHRPVWQAPLRPVARDRPLPVSFAQQRLLFTEQLNPGKSLYNESIAIRLKGEVQVAALERSLSEIVRRHEILRTVFSTSGDEILQQIAPARPQTLERRDLRHLHLGEVEAGAQRIAEAEVEQPFDFARGPLFRTVLMQLAQNDHLLLVIFHQTIGDGWSMSVLFHELAALYMAFCAGEPSPLAEPLIQYADYTLWQRQWAQADALQEQFAYWRQQLQDPPDQLALPLDRPRPIVPTSAGAQQTLHLSYELSQQLKALGLQENVTLFVTLLSAFSVLLMRYSGQHDLLIGSPIANRTRRELEDVMGFFVNTLVLRVDLSGNPRFQALLGRVREMTLDAYAHQDLPFEQLVAHLDLKRDLLLQPLFQVAFVLQNFPLSFDLPGISWSQFHLSRTTSRFDLVVTLNEEDERLLTTVEYSTDLFEAATIERLLRHWQALLEAIVHAPGEQIEKLLVMEETEREQILDAHHHIAQQGQSDQCLHQLFELQVEQTPDSVALVFQHTAVTYQQLNARANQVAQYLRNESAGFAEPAPCVGLVFERSFDMIIGMLAVLKAGYAFVPLDPASPQARLAFLLQDAHVPILLTGQAVVAGLPEHSAAVVCLDTDWETISKESTANVASHSSADTLAYAIYTSGSTGTPKGVLVPHRGACNLARAQIQLFDVAAGSRVLQFASFSFDAFISEILMALLSGATLHLATQDSLLPGPALFRLFNEHAITHVTLPPSVLAAFPTTLQMTLQTLIVAGEICPAEVASSWAGRTRFFNAYGPTEGTVCATCAHYTPESQKSACIGYPIANVEVYVLDAHQQLVPVGMPGELYIGGAGLAYGYLNRPDLTAERFVPDPFHAREGKRLYRTGDLAYYQADGSLIFLGRRDRQVKVHGVRIELEEIEAVLNTHQAVQQSAVVLQEAGCEHARLLAYIVPAHGKQDAESRQTELWPSVAEYFIYDELLYFAMTHDERRNQRYRAAINRTVKDRVVVDIGTGKDAILARFCVEGGARRVYALEILEESYEQARICIQQLGLEEKIILIHGDARTVDLPEKVDVCVSEIVGSIGGSEGAASILNDARRFLKPGATVIPARSQTKIAAVSLPADLRADPGFTGQTAGYVNKIFTQIGYQFDLRLCVKSLSYRDLASSTGVCEDLDFTAYVEPAYQREIVLTIQKQAKIDGFLLWLHLCTIAGEEIDILQEEVCWLPVYFPVFYPGIDVSEGDRIQMTCAGTLSENNLNPDYTLSGCVIRERGETIPFRYTSYHHTHLFKSNAFYQELFPHNNVKVQRPIRTGLPSSSLADDVRGFLRQRLPASMLPATFVTLDTLPLTTSGKVDLQKLSTLGETSARSSAVYVPPRTVAEQSIADIWQEVLDLEQVGIHNNFFDLGGHSLLLGRVQEGLLAALGKEVSMVDLFTYPTISALIEHINQGEKKEHEELQQSYTRAETRRTSVQRRRQIR
jgi:natural product biosynthesis luciferase-like monooxygenase protein/amino acid adenylation domain-containing protein